MSNAELIYEEVKTLSESRSAQVLDFVKHIKQEEAGEECPICAKHRDPVTGELRFKPEIMAGMQDVEDMISGKVPAKWYNSLDEMMVALDEDD